MCKLRRFRTQGVSSKWVRLQRKQRKSAEINSALFHTLYHVTVLVSSQTHRCSCKAQSRCFFSNGCFNPPRERHLCQKVLSLKDISILISLGLAHERQGNFSFFIKCCKTTTYETAFKSIISRLNYLEIFLQRMKQCIRWFIKTI